MRRVEDVHEMLNLVNLTEVFPTELSAVRATNEVGSELVQSQELMWRDIDGGFEILLRASISAQDANYRVGLVAQYKRSEPFDADESVVKEFIEQVALMTLWPYLRSAVSELGTRLRTSTITLGLLRQGGVSLSREARASDPGVAQ